MDILSKLFSGGASELVNSVGGTLDNLITSKEEKLQLENELRKAEMDFEVEMRKLSVEERRMYLDDTDSARQRETAVQTSANATRLGKNVSAYLALGTTVLTFILFYVLVFQPKAVNEEKKDVVIYILGVLSAIVTQIFSYYFGSSAGSADKSRIMEQQLAKK